MVSSYKAQNFVASDAALLTHEDWLVRIGEQARDLRIARNMQQLELAKAANVSIGSIRNLEAGRGSTLTTLIQVVRVLRREDWLAQLYAAPSVRPMAMIKKKQNRMRVRRETKQFSD